MRGRFFGNTQTKTPPRKSNFAKTSTRFKPDGGDIRTFRILEAESAFIYAYHYLRGYKICTDAIPEFDSKCVYCAYGDGKSVPRRRVLEVFDFTYYHLVDNGTDWPDEIECGSKGPRPKAGRCAQCSHHLPAVQARHLGGHRIWELNQTQFEQLWSVNDELSMNCIHGHEEGTYCGGEVTTDHFRCPECEHVGIDDSIAPMMNNQQLMAARREMHNCVNCGQDVILVEVQVCDKSDGENEHEAVPASVFDKKLRLTASAVEKKLRGGKIAKTISYNFNSGEQYSNVVEDLVAEGLDMETIEKMLEPWDVAKRYRPERVDRSEYGENTNAYVAAVLDKQAETLGKDNPYQVEVSGGNSTPFSGARFR